MKSAIAVVRQFQCRFSNPEETVYRLRSASAVRQNPVERPSNLPRHKTTRQYVALQKPDTADDDEQAGQRFAWQCSQFTFLLNSETAILSRPLSVSTELLSHGAVARRPWHRARNLTEHLADIVCDTWYNRSRCNHHEPGQESTLQQIVPLPVRPNPELQTETVQSGSSVLARRYCNADPVGNVSSISGTANRGKRLVPYARHLGDLPPKNSSTKSSISPRSRLGR
jgi:hypothetical protein